jgi:ABC-type polysaccharide/polyol phosphate transport system ATPase subunit
MSSEHVIDAAGLGRMYQLYDRPQDRLKQAFLWGRKKLYREFWALREVSFKVRRGEALGIIGRNGSGKSTLLQMVAGTLRPSEGRLRVQGRAAALLELGSGFNPAFTGRENVYVNGAILGMTRREIDARFDQILEFAEIGDFIDQPVKTYSSGMVVRLAFAVQVCVEPELLIVDEALSVGDIFFQQKCFTRAREIVARGTTLLLVSHDVGAVRNLCHRVLLLDAGRLVFAGDSADAVARYYALVGQDLPARAEFKVSVHEATEEARKSRATLRRASILHADDTKRHGPRGLAIEAARVSDRDGRTTLAVEMLQPLTFDILVRANRSIAAPNVGVEISDRFGNLVYGTGALQLGRSLPALQAGDEILLRFAIEMSVQPGEYTFALAAAETTATGNPNAGIFQDRFEGLGPITVHYSLDRLFPFYGVARLPAVLDFDVFTDRDGADSSS